MIRTALRLGVLPLLAALIMLLGVGVPLWQWFAIGLLSPFALGLILLSYWRLKADPPSGAIPLWARKISPWIWGVCVALIVSVPLTSWRLQLAFKAAKPRLERLRAQVQAGEPIVWPQRAGEFEIRDVHVEDGEIAFYLDDSGPPTSLIYSAPRESPQREANLAESSSAVVLGENWIYYEPLD